MTANFLISALMKLILSEIQVLNTSFSLILFFFLFLMDFVFVFLAQLEETFSFRLPIQLRGNKEPSIPEFLSKIENLLETKKTSGSCIKSATSVSSVVMTQENDS